jgi:YYY domain-containing protein
MKDKHWLLCCLVIGVALRLTGLLHGIGFHPDERHIIMTTQKIGWHSLNPEFFAYGSLPFYSLRIASGLLSYIFPSAIEYENLFLVGRLLSVCIFIVTSLVMYRIAYELTKNKPTALGAVALLAVNPFHLQLSHFYTVDPILTATSLITLLGVIRTTNSGRYRDYLCMGIGFGLSFGTKISSLSLLLPITCAFLWDTYKRCRWKSWSLEYHLGIFLITSIVIFIIVEPYALLDFSRFYSDNRSQIEMVAGRWIPPYTIQYVNTPKYIYHIKQMGDHTIGWFILLASVIGSLIVMKSKSAPWTLILLWMTGTFAIIGGSYVKFPRYLLSLYPIIIILASTAFNHTGILLTKIFPIIPSKLRQLPLVIGILSTLTPSLALANLYLSEHSWIRVSRWMHQHLPPESTLINASWDDSLPVYTPNQSATSFKIKEAKWYNLNSNTEIHELATTLANGDFVIFATGRIPGSILRYQSNFYDQENEAQHRLAIAALNGLFSGNLGYTKYHTFKTYPTFLNYKWDTDLADESLSVYDHPKTFILKNSKRLSAETIFDQIQKVASNNIIQDKVSDKILTTPTTDELSPWPSSILAIIIWVFTIEGLALLWTPIIFSIWNVNPLTAFCFTRPSAMFVSMAIIWVAGSLLPLTITPNLIIIACLAVNAPFLPNLGNILRQHWRAYRLAAIIWICPLLVCITIRSAAPEIYWGEKPMDFSFLNYFTRLDFLPPSDPWASNQPMYYYYFSYFMFGNLLKITGIDPAIGYNLSLTTIIPLLISSICGVLSLIIKSSRAVISWSIFIVASANIEAVLLLFSSDRNWNFDLFWATTRLFTEPGFTEFPLWSFLFGDLHGHVVALPIVTLILGHCIAINIPRYADKAFSIYTLLGIFSGILFITNAWDIVFCFSIILVSICIKICSQCTKNPYLNFPSNLIKSLFCEAYNAIGLIAGIIIIVIFQFTSGKGLPPNISWVTASEHNTAGMILRMYGHFIFILFGGGFFLLFNNNSGVSLRNVLRGTSVAILPLVVIAAAYLLGYPTIISGHPQMPIYLPSGIFYLSCIICGIGGSFIFSQTLSLKLVVPFIIICGYVFTGVEAVSLMDRMNTVFKFYYPLWILFGITSACLGYQFFLSIDRNKFVKFIIVISCIIAGIPLALSSIALIVITMQTARVQGPRPTLNGAKYLERESPGDNKIVQWLNSNVEGTPNIAEAHGDSYGNFGRITMMTGLPSMIGWSHHVWQRGISHSEINERIKDLRHIYQTTNSFEAQALLNKYNIRFIIFGARERQAYGEEGLQKFLNSSFCKQIVYWHDQNSEDTFLFEVTLG